MNTHTGILEGSVEDALDTQQHMRRRIRDAVRLLSDIWRGEEDSFWNSLDENLDMLQEILEEDIETEKAYRDKVLWAFYPLSLDAIEVVHGFLGQTDLWRLRQLQSCFGRMPMIQSSLKRFGKAAFLGMVFESEMEMLPIQSVVFDEDRESEGKSPFVDSDGNPFTGLGVDLSKYGSLSVTMFINGSEITREQNEPILYQGLKFQDGGCFLANQESSDNLLNGSIFQTESVIPAIEGFLVEEDDNWGENLAMQWHCHRRGHTLEQT